jgi:short-subunit dehydrogenase
VTRKIFCWGLIGAFLADPSSSAAQDFLANRTPPALTVSMPFSSQVLSHIPLFHMSGPYWERTPVFAGALMADYAPSRDWRDGSGSPSQVPASPKTERKRWRFGRASVSYKDKVVFITGASSGLGKALAYEFARRGAKVVLTARRMHLLEEIAADLMRQGYPALPIQCDVTRPEQIDRAMELTKQRFGQIDVVVANAGVIASGPLGQVRQDDISNMNAVNVLGAQYTAKAAIPELLRMRGHLILMGSVMGYISLPDDGPYAASKHALLALGRSIAMDYHRQLDVTYLAPGYVDTEMEIGPEVPRSWILDADVAARRLMKGIEKRKREVLINWYGYLAWFFGQYMPWAVSTVLPLFINKNGHTKNPPPTAGSPSSPPASFQGGGRMGGSAFHRIFTSA